MQAVQFGRFGGPEVLELVQADEPAPGAGQIRVRVRAVGCNPFDAKLRAGAMGGELPLRTGLELAGVVDALGEGVNGVAAGDEVFGPAVGGAGAAELALVAEWAPIPPALDFASAAALPVAIETARRTLDLLGVGPGQTLLVSGASGAVGSAAVQLAVVREVRVIGTAGERNQDYVRSLGAEPTVYGDGLVERVRELAPDGVDRALDAAGGGALPALVELTGSSDRVLTIADFAGAERAGVRASGGAPAERAWHVLGEIGALIEAGRFRLPVAQTFPLAQIADAHRVLEGSHPPGKIVLLVD
ncbi:MAG: NADP-dependent oxidoreductase [Solirubrobacteraceae bacterium]